MNVLPSSQGGCNQGGKGAGAGPGERRRPPAPQGHAATARGEPSSRSRIVPFPAFPSSGKTTAFVFVWFLTKDPILHSQGSWSRGLGTGRECSHYLNLCYSSLTSPPSDSHQRNWLFWNSSLKGGEKKINNLFFVSMFSKQNILSFLLWFICFV